MLDTIERGRRIAFRELATKTELFLWTVDDHHHLDADICPPLFEGFEEADKLPALIALGCLCHPLMQNEKRIVASGLITNGQAKHVVQDLLTIMEQHYEGRVGKEMTATLTEHMNAGNEYSTAEDFIYRQQTPKKKAIEEWNMYRHWCLPLYQPVMEATKVIGDVDSDEQPRMPVYEFGKVLRRGKYLPNEHFDALRCV